MIKNIHCFGTSFTAGGGFEFDSLNKSRNELLKDFYSNYGEILSQYNFSWPGQLQKNLHQDDKDIKVYNHAKNGYGNEMVYRKVFNLIFSDTFISEENLLLIEFSALGRWEFFSNSLNDYVIFNYQVNRLPNSDHWDIANTYNYDNAETRIILEKIKKDSFDFFKEVINKDKFEERLVNNNIMFLSFLELKKINYMITCPPVHYFDKKGDFLLNEISMLDKLFKFEDYIDFISYFSKKNMTITDETNGKIEDIHSGFLGNKNIANIIYEQLKEKRYDL